MTLTHLNGLLNLTWIYRSQTNLKDGNHQTIWYLSHYMLFTMKGTWMISLITVTIEFRDIRAAANLVTAWWSTKEISSTVLPKTPLNAPWWSYTDNSLFIDPPANCVLWVDRQWINWGQNGSFRGAICGVSSPTLISRLSVDASQFWLLPLAKEFTFFSPKSPCYPRINSITILLFRRFMKNMKPRWESPPEWHPSPQCHASHHPWPAHFIYPTMCSF
jgi:hypothetical protein